MRLVDAAGACAGMMGLFVFAALVTGFFASDIYNESIKKRYVAVCIVCTTIACVSGIVALWLGAASGWGSA